MKKTQIIIITIALALTLVCIGTFAVLYFATDTFKSDKDLFYKYASQINLKEFIDLESYSAYSERLKATGHANEGEFYIELANAGETINETVKYNGYTDPINKTANYDISINKDNETLLAMNYLNIQDFYGLQFKDVVNQYIVLENNNLKEFALKMGIEDTSEIPNKIEIPEVVEKINYQEINTILNNYLNIAIEEIPEDNYSKIKKQEISLGEETIEADGYQVKLKVKDVQKILTKVLENARDDEQIYNLLNSEDITFEDYQEYIDEIILEISGEIPSEENVEVFTISVYKQGKNTIKLSLELAIEEAEVDVELSIENTSKGMMLKFVNTTVNYDETEDKNIITITKTLNSEEKEKIEMIASQKSDEEEMEILNISMERNGILTSNNVTFDLNIIFSIDMSLFDPTAENPSLKIGMKNSTNFAGVPKEGEFVQGNHLVINGLAPEQIQNLGTNLGKILGEKLKGEMFVSMITSVMTVNQGLFERAQQAGQEWENEIEQESTLGTISMNDQLVETFNSQFTPYEGTRRGAEIKSLYNMISASNTTSPEHVVVYSGPAQEEIVSTKDYNVSTIKDEEGYVNQIIIEENAEESTTNDYIPENFSVNVQSTNGEVSTMSQMFSEGQEFLNN